jgi:transposase
MYFRQKKSNSGKVLQLLESYRNGEGQPRNRVVLSIGDADITKEDRTVIAKAVESKLYGYLELLEHSYSKPIQDWIDLIVRKVDKQGRWHPSKSNQQINAFETDVDNMAIDGVLIDKIEHCNTTELGPELLGFHAWEQLDMPQALKKLGFSDVQCHRAAVSVINRLIDPVSEYKLDRWTSQTSLPELISDTVLGKGYDRFYRISDKLFDNKDVIESHIRKAQGKLFNPDRTILLYDLTNTHFEGECKSNPKAVRGKNKQKRNDCPQVTVGMVFDGSGFELTHQVFEGNKSDSKSLVDIVSKLELILKKNDPQLLEPPTKPIVIVDAGIASKGNLALLRKNGYSYLVNDSRTGRANYRDYFSNEKEFKKIKNREDKSPVRVRLLEEKTYKTNTKTKEEELDYIEHLVLCKSDGRQVKEKTIVSNAENKFLTSLNKLREQIKKGTLKDYAKIQRRIGKIQARHGRVQRFYDVELKKSSEKDVGNLVWLRKDDKFLEAEMLFGCYVLRTDQLDFTADDLWRIYITLTKAEDGFRMLKSQLGLRPNRHQIEDRVDGHIFITVLAYQLLCFITKTMESHGDNRSWETVRRLMRTHCYATVILPTINGTIYRIRKPGRPEECQQAIYNMFDIDLKKLPKSKMIIEQSGAVL